MLKWVVLTSLIAIDLVKLPAPTVRTSAGLVRGRLSDNGRFYQYFGIPYATVDDSNRFQAPLPVTPWSGVLDVQDENAWCIQKTHIGVVGDPNCLKLYLYSPIHRTHELLPVMVFIHGGCFFEGTGSPFLYGGDNFAEHVVFVAINYRLGVEGFLCLGTKEAPGNAGLKDQLAALKWIKNNIKSFGGNPDDVTLFGESAGAVSTSLMILSSEAKGLFHKAILQSGSSLAPWGIQHDPIATASELVKYLGYDTKDLSEIHRILSSKSPQELAYAIRREGQFYCVANDHLFVPCVEKHVDGVAPFITEYPSNIILSGNYIKIPMIIGFTDREGIYFTSADYGNSLKNGSREINLSTALKKDLHFPNDFERNCTADRVKKHYFSSYDDEMIMNMVDFYSDLYFKFPLIVEADMYARTTNQPIFYYLFKYNGLLNLPKFISHFGLKDGASHADELFYMFKPHAFPLPQNIMEKKMIGKMVTMWTNFAKYSDPTPTQQKHPFRWRPSRESNPIALIIDGTITTAPLWEPKSVLLWNETYNRYRRRNYGMPQFYVTLNGTT